MRTPSLRHLAAVTALALASVAAAAACGHPAPVEVRALPVQTPGTAPTTTAPGSPTTKPAHTTAAEPTHTRPATPCRGAVIYPVDASDTGRAWPRLCITVGGVLRVTNLGPDGFSMTPSDKVSCWYEAGVRECRLIRTGTVRFVMTSAHQTRPLTLVIAGASVPPKPSPACLNAQTIHPLDAAEGGPPWSALCMKVGAVLRVENLGPDGFSVNPRSAVSCVYEGGIRQCRFVKAATVTFAITRPQLPTRSLTVVAIR